MSQLELFTWARDPIFKKIRTALLSPESKDKTINGVMSKCTTGEGKRLERHSFVSAIQSVSSDINSKKVEDLAEQLLIPSTQMVDLTKFYEAYHSFIPDVTSALYEKAGESEVSKEDKKIINTLADYMKSNKHTSLSDFLQLTSGSLTKTSLKSFLDKNFLKLSESEKNSFIMHYTSESDPDRINLTALQNSITDAMAPETLEEFLDLTFTVLIENACDLKEFLKDPLTSNDFAINLKNAGLPLSTNKLLEFFNVIDEDKEGAIKAEAFIKKLEEHSISKSEIKKSHIAYQVIQKIREAIRSGNKPLHCITKEKAYKQGNSLYISPKELRKVIENTKVVLSEEEYNKLFTYLNPIKSAKIFYNRFFNALGYIQPRGSTVSEVLLSKVEEEEKLKEEVKGEEESKVTKESIPEKVIPLIKALKEVCKINRKTLKATLEKHGLLSNSVKPEELYNVLHYLTKERIKNIGFSKAFAELPEHNNNILLSELYEMYDKYEYDPLILSKEEMLKFVAERLEEREIDIREITFIDAELTEGTIREEFYKKLLTNKLSLNTNHMLSFEALLKEYKKGEDKVSYTQFFIDLNRYLIKYKVTLKQEDYNNMLADIRTEIEKTNTDLNELFVNADAIELGRVSIGKFADILMRLKIDKYRQGDYMSLGIKYIAPRNNEVQYKLFLVDINKDTKYSPIAERVHWASNILDDIAISFYIKKTTALNYFKEYGLDKKTETVSQVNFEKGINFLGVEIGESDLEKLGKDLDLFRDNTVSIQQLNILIESRVKVTIQRLESKICKLINNVAKEKGVDLRKNLSRNEIRSYDVHAVSEVRIDIFQTELRLLMGTSMRPLHYNFLEAKYQERQGRIAYKKFLNDLEQDELRDSDTGIILINDITIKLLDRLRHTIREKELRVANHLLEVNENEVFPCEILKEVIPDDILNEDDYKQLILILRAGSIKKFTYESICEALWIDEQEEVNRETFENYIQKLNDNIKNHTKKNGIDLEKELATTDHDNDGYMSSEDIKKAFKSIKLALSNRQLAALLYYQNLPTDHHYRKNYVELLNRIYGENHIGTRFPHIRIPSPSNVEKRAIEEELKSVRKEEKQSEIKISHAKHEKIIKAVARKLGKGDIDIEEEFKKSNMSKIKCLSRDNFLQTLSKSGVYLTANEATEIFAVGEMIDNNQMVNYEKFLEILEEQEEYSKFKKKTEEVKVKEEVIFIPHEVSLTQEQIKEITECFQTWRKYFKEQKVDIQSEFAKENQEGFIKFSTYSEVLSRNNANILNQKMADEHYSYLKEDPDNKISHQRLVETLVKGKVLTQYRTPYLKRKELKEKATAGISIFQRLCYFMKDKKLSPLEFNKYTKERSITKEEIKSCFDDIKFKYSPPELDSFFELIDTKKENKGSMPRLLMTLSKEMNKDLDEFKVKLKQQHYDTINSINDQLLLRNYSYSQFQKAVDTSGDGYANFNQFLSGVTRALGMDIAQFPLSELFAAWDIYKYIFN